VSASAAKQAKPGPDEIRLRPFEDRDLRELVALDAICFAPALAYSSAELTYFLRHPRSSSLVAEAASGIVGFVIFDWRLEQGRRVGHFITVDVSPARRRAGLGTRLMVAAEEARASAGCTSVLLEVATGNAPAQALYRSLGYGFTGRIPGYYPDGSDAVVMRKALG
jgi:ribosomal-protein-alanine N-acetyltransferase